MTLDRETTGRCRHLYCGFRAARAGLCFRHWREVWGNEPAPAPTLTVEDRRATA